MKILILCPSEICYNPRLLKAADYFHSNGCEVTVYNAVTGLASKDVYESVKNSRSWRIVENDITKRTAATRRRWMYSSVIHKLAGKLFGKLRNMSLFSHVLTKGYVLFPKTLASEHFDFILIHLVDTLPFAVKLKKKTGARVIYDCQEYFKGQYEHAAPLQKSWVYEAENKYAGRADIILATTQVMLDKLQQEIKGPKIFLRVRNTPTRKKIAVLSGNPGKFRMIWHGLTIVPQNVRGIHILLHAVAQSKSPVELFLQGNITAANAEKLDALTKELGIHDRVHVLKAANPDNIVESLTSYDIGAVGELAAEDNQRLTSSNKLFEFINAGLPVLVPDLPGLAETVNEYKVGMLYKQGDSSSLAACIDTLYNDPAFLQTLKTAALKAAETELYWEHDYQKVWSLMKEIAR